MEELKKHHVLPEVIHELPEQILEVGWPHSGVKAHCGNILTPSDMKSQPYVHWDADQNSFYTLMMIDPDAPTRQSPKFKEWQHWLVVNIPGNNVSQGDEKTAYIGAGPPKGTGLHRYVFLVFKQQYGKQDFSDLPILSSASGKHREKFHSKQFAKTHHLGPLVAANFVQAEWDEHVDVLHKSLMGNF